MPTLYLMSLLQYECEKTIMRSRLVSPVAFDDSCCENRKRLTVMVAAVAVEVMLYGADELILHRLGSKYSKGW